MQTTHILNKSVKQLMTFVMLVALVSIPPSSKACTVFVSEPDSNMIMAKNFDWKDGKGFVLYSPAKVLRQYAEGEKKEESKWSSFSFHLDSVGQEFPMGGMNEKGLTIEVVWLRESVYVTDKPGEIQKSKITDLGLVRYILDNASSIDDVKTSLKKYTVIEKLEPLHFISCDLNECLVFEFLEKQKAADDKMENEKKEGELKITENLPYRVLANLPYGNAIDKLKIYENFGGTRPLTGVNPSARFAIASYALTQSQHPSAEDALTLLTNKLSVPLQNLKTQWSYVYEPNKGKITVHDGIGENEKTSFSEMPQTITEPQILFHLGH